MAGLKFVTFNGNGLGDQKKLNKVLTWCKKYKPQVVFLQETHCIQSRESWYMERWGGDWYHSMGEGNSRGVSTLISKEIDYTLVEKVIDVTGRYVVLDIKIDGRGYIFGNYYGANIDCPEHLEEYLLLLTPNDGQEIVSAGDYNFVLNVNMDKRGGRPRTHEKSKNLLLNWNNNMETIDIWRIQHPDIFDYT